MENYKKLFMIIILSVGFVILFYFNGTDFIQPHITKLQQYMNQMTNYSQTFNSNSNRDSLKSSSSIKQDIPQSTKLHQNVNQMTNYSQTFTSISYRESLKSSTSINQDIPVNKKTIVMLNSPSWTAMKLIPNMFDKCEVSACRFHFKEPFKYVNHSDAVILYAVGYSSKRFLARKPKKGQIWIFAVWESSPHSHSEGFNKAILKNQINWTMTYRLDSDIPAPYGIVTKISGQSKNYTKIMAEKLKLAAQVVSHCPTQSLREQYVKTLQIYIQVDVYGLCGPDKKRNTDAHFSQKIEKSYKFYLAFENSLCRDYVTEKFFEWQNRSIVPIVRGDGDYEHFYPKNSYIDVRDFKSISDLAKYIKYLDKNDTAYIEYLKAKENYVVTGGSRSNFVEPFCQLCKMVHNPDKYRNYYPNVQDWYSKGTCRKPTDLE